MQKEFRNPDTSSTTAVRLAVLLAVMLGASAAAHGQSTGIQGQQTIPSPISGNPDPGPFGNPQKARMEEQREQLANDDRRKRMVADADKLLQLAIALKAEVDKSTRNETSVTAYQRANEIEHLAHDVKERLKN